MPRTSIVTLTQDRPDYLAEAIASVEAQTDSDWEHLVYDNGSRDPRVLEILREAKGRNPDRFFFTSPGGRGPVVPALYWNILLGLARGRYLTILDDDNRKHPHFLERMTTPMEALVSVDAVSCGWQCIDAGGNVTALWHLNQHTSIPVLVRSNTIDSNALVFRRSVLDKIGLFSVDLGACEDWHFTIRLARYCTIQHLSEALIDYREHVNARSQTVSQGALERVWNRIRTEMFTAEERLSVGEE